MPRFQLIVNRYLLIESTRLRLLLLHTPCYRSSPRGETTLNVIFKTFAWCCFLDACVLGFSFVTPLVARGLTDYYL